MFVGSFVWLVVLQLWYVQSVPIHKFYPYGVENGDNQLSRFQHESASPEITLRVSVKFFSETYSSLYVNSNGLISFITPLPTFVNVQFPLDYPVVAALYANTDTRTTGSIYYRETDNSTLLDRISQEIRQSFPNTATQFQAKDLFIATWYRVGYYNRRADKVNTYQIVIASNDEESYIEFLYADDGVQWLQGEGLPGTGLLDAKAQAGIVAANGRTHILQGSGTDQIRNLVRLSNTNEAGVWIFKVGAFDNETNVGVPIISQILSEQASYGDQITSCAIGYSKCHSQATCTDSPRGFCCTCRQGFYGNGFNCLKDGTPLRATGKAYIDVNGIKVNQVDLQAYIVVQDGRVYTAISKIPPTLGSQLQLLYPITTMLNWIFAKPTGNGLNGFQITGGALTHSAEILYKESKDRVTVTQKFFGMDVFDQLKLEVNIRGSVPQDRREYKLTINDYQEQFNFISKGLFRSSSSLTYTKTIVATGQEEQQEVSLDQVIQFNESCIFNYYNITNGQLDPSQRAQYSYYRVKTARNFVAYENRENILRFAATSKVSLLKENEDPCIEGRVKCVANSSCVVEGDTFRCICNPGFQTTYSSRYSDSRSNDFGCLDVNECAEGRATCDSNALCINEVGSYQCLCKPGFSGNGYFCSEIESPCVRNPTLCNPPNSHCVDPTDPRTCDCLTGYQKQYLNSQQIGFVCLDINECELQSNYTNICGLNAYCVNYPGSYTCNCQEGFTREGNTCQQKEASCNVLRNCSPNGECIYDEIVSKYTCRCINGYYGDGYICQQYGGRKIVSKVCTSGTCVCPPRFIPNGRFCIETEEGTHIPTESTISCNTISSLCHPQAQCVYNSTNQQYQCICNSGFEGSGIECTETETSCLRNDICDLHASCEPESNGKAHCVCNAHYHGDGIQCIYSGMCNSDGDCEQNEECAYNEGSYSYECKCRQGYFKEQNSTCRPVYTCPLCHPAGQCVLDDLTKKYYCECTSGYQGNGLHCERIPSSCNTANICSPYATCVQNATKDSFQCQCRQGYIGNGTYCKRERTCLQDPELCNINAKCINTPYDVQPYCECNQGFTGNGSYCSESEKVEGGFLFVNHGMSTLRIPYPGNSSKPGYPIQLQANQLATGLAVDCVEGKVYWSDYLGHAIKGSNYKGKNIKTLVNNDISAPEGLTIDWLGRTLYWTDSGKKVIKSINLDGSNVKTIISTNLTNPRGIAVHPYKRKLFWTDWNRAQPKIEWSNLDGTDRSIFLSGAEVQLPNSVSIDWSTDELCWADAGTKRISCAGIENRRPRLVTSNAASPFGLTISNEKYFWTDWSPPGKVGYYDRYTSKTENIPLPSVGSATLYGIVAVPNNCP